MSVKILITILIVTQVSLSFGEPEPVKVKQTNPAFPKRYYGPGAKPRTKQEIQDILALKDGGSRCPGVTCMPPPTTGNGRPCDPSYEENSEKCCPMWTCSSTMMEEEDDDDVHAYSYGGGGSISGRSAQQSDTWGNFEEIPSAFEPEVRKERYGPLNQEEARKVRSHHYQQNAFQDGKHNGPYPKSFDRNRDHIKFL